MNKLSQPVPESPMPYPPEPHYSKDYLPQEAFGFGYAGHRAIGAIAKRGLDAEMEANTPRSHSRKGGSQTDHMDYMYY